MNPLEERLRTAIIETGAEVPHDHSPPLRLPRPPSRPPSWLPPVAAAVAVTLTVGLALSLGGVFSGWARSGGQAGNTANAATAYIFNGDGAKGTLTPISATGRLGKPVTVGPGARQVTMAGGRGRPGLRSMRPIRLPSIWQNVVTPNGKTDYVAYTGKNGTDLLRRVSLVTGAAGRPIRLGPGAQQIAVTPNGATAYVIYSYYPAGAARRVPLADSGTAVVRPVSLATGTVGRPVLRGHGQAQIALTPDGTTAYITFSSPGTVTPVSTATNTAGKPIPVPGADHIVMTSDGKTADVLSTYNNREQTVTPISTATNTPGMTVRAGRGTVDDVVITPDGQTAYKVNQGTSVVPVSIATGRAGKPIKLNGAGQMVITPDGKTAYVTNMINGRVTPISTATNTPGKPIKMPGFPLYLAVRPDGKTVYGYDAGYGQWATKQIVTPITTATNTPGKPITVMARGIAIVIAGNQDTP